MYKKNLKFYHTIKHKFLKKKKKKKLNFNTRLYPTPVICYKESSQTSKCSAPSIRPDLLLSHTFVSYLLICNINLKLQHHQMKYWVLLQFAYQLLSPFSSLQVNNKRNAKHSGKSGCMHIIHPFVAIRTGSAEGH